MPGFRAHGRPAEPVRKASEYRIERPARLGSAVVSVLVDRIAGGEFPPGSVLPPEPELAAEFGVSRTVIREALKGIEEKGVARIQQGRGTTVLDMSRWNVLDDEVLAAMLRHDDSFSVLSDLVQVRASLESGMGALAARRITDDQIAELKALLDRMDTLVGTHEEYGPVEHQFHMLIIEASGNLIGNAVTSAIGKHLRLGGRRWISDVPHRERLKVVHAGHHEIYRQIAHRNASGAAKAVFDHIRTSWAWVERERDAVTRRTGTVTD